MQGSVSQSFLNKSPVGRLIFPFGHRPEDVAMYDGNEDLTFLGMYVPKDVLMNEVTTVRQYKCNIHDETTKSYQALEDLLLAFVNYRLKRVHLTDESKKRRITNQLVPRKGPVQSRSETSVVATVVQIPRFSNNSDASDPAMRIVWSHPSSESKDSDDSDQKSTRSYQEMDQEDNDGSVFLYGEEDEKVRRSAAIQEDVALPPLTQRCSYILGDSDDGADKSCALYQGASFVGRMIEVAIKEEGNAPIEGNGKSEEFLSFDHFCRQYIAMSHAMYSEDSIREHKIRKAQGKACKNTGGDMVDAAEEKWVDYYDIHLRPAETILSIRDFLEHAQRVDNHPWTNLPEATYIKEDIFSAFYSLQKQVKLLERLDIYPQFKRFESYVSEGRPVLNLFPALRKRLLPKEVDCWLDTQSMSLPLPCDIVNFDEAKFKIFFKNFDKRTPVSVTASEEAIGLPRQRENEENDDSDVGRELMMMRRQELARQAFGREVGIGQSADTVTHQYLKSKNTKARAAINEKYRLKMEKVPKPTNNDQKRAYDRKRERIRTEFNHELLSFARQAASEVGRTIFHEQGSDSEAIRLAASTLAQLLEETNGKIDMGIFKSSTNLTFMGDFWTYFALLLDIVLDVCHTHDNIPILYASALNACDPHDGLHPNILQNGGAGFGKSFNFGVMNKFILKGLMDSLSSMTTNAMKDGKSRDGIIEIWEEAKDSWFGVTKGRSGGGGDDEARMKAKLTSNAEVSLHGWIDKESGRRLTKRTYHSCKNVTWINANNIGRYSDAGLSRFIVITVTNRSRTDHNISDMIQDQVNPDKLLIQEHVSKQFTLINCLVSATFTLIKCGVMDPVSTKVTETIWGETHRRLKELKIPLVRHPTRLMEMTYGLVRSITIVRALLIRFGSPDSVFYGNSDKRFDVPSLLEALVTLQPDLVDADPTIGVHLISLMSFVDKTRFDVIEAIGNVFFRTTPWCKNPFSNGIRALIFNKRGLAAKKTETVRQQKKTKFMQAVDARDPEPQDIFMGEEEYLDNEEEEEDPLGLQTIHSMRLASKAKKAGITPALMNRVNAFATPQLSAYVPTSRSNDVQDNAPPSVPPAPAAPVRMTYPTRPRGCKVMCRCENCIDFRELWLEANEQEINETARSVTTDHTHQEQRLRDLQGQHTLMLRQQRVIELYHSVSDENGVNIIENSLEYQTRQALDNEEQKLNTGKSTLPAYEEDLQYEEIRQSVAKTFARDTHLKVDLGVYFVAKDPFKLHADQLNSNISIQHDKFIKKIAHRVYVYMISNSISTPSLEAIKKHVKELFQLDIPAHFLRCPTAPDAGLGAPTPNDLSKDECHTIKALTIINGDLAIAVNTLINNPVDPMRCVMQETLEYSAAYPRSYLYGLHSNDLPYLYGTINVIPNNRRFITRSPHRYTTEHHHWLQAGLTAFTNIPSTRTGTNADENKVLQDESAPVTKASASTSDISVHRAMASSERQLMDYPFEDVAYWENCLKYGFTPQQMAHIGSSTQSNMDKRRLEIQKNFKQKQLESDPESENAEQLKNFEPGPYPMTILNSIRQDEEQTERLRVESLTGTSAPTSSKPASAKEIKIANTVEHLSMLYPHSDIGGFIQVHEKSENVWAPLMSASKATETTRPTQQVPLRTEITTTTQIPLRRAQKQPRPIESDDEPPTRPGKRPRQEPSKPSKQPPRSLNQPPRSLKQPPRLVIRNKTQPKPKPTQTTTTFGTAAGAMEGMDSLYSLLM